MTELYIEGQAVVLPDDLSLTLNEDNPEITNNGDFTWDMELSLLNPVNAKIFEHLNRINISVSNPILANAINTTEVINGVNTIIPPVGNNAILIVDNKIRHGKIIVISNTDVKVNTQFVAGNSELNYIAKDQKIWAFDWGTEDTINFSKAYQSISYPGYGLQHISFGYDIQINYVCAPVKIGGTIYNDYKLTNNSQTPGVPITEVTDIIMQPYLLYYINKLPSVLGFTMGTNILNSDDRAQKMYLINSVNSLKYADALPDITIAEFITAVSNFFNVSFLVDASTKIMNIVSLSINISTKKIVIPVVVDAYQRDLNEDVPANSFFDFTKVKYSIPTSTTYFKYQQLSDDIIAKCQIAEFDNFAALRDFIEVSHEFINQLYIYRDKELNNDYFYGIPGINLYSVKETSDLSKYLNLINKFAPVGDTDDRILELKITPAEITINKKPVTLTIGGYPIVTEVAYQLPVCSNSYYIAVEQGFVDAVESGPINITRSKSIEVALFTGMLHTFDVAITFSDYASITPTYPFSHTDNYPEVGTYGNSANRFVDFENWRTTYFTPFATKRMRLKGAGGIISDYHQQSIIDTTIQYLFTIQETPDTSAANLFSINNKTYMPISLEHTVVIKGFEKEVKGKFYALK